MLKIFKKKLVIGGGASGDQIVVEPQPGMTSSDNVIFYSWPW